MFIPKSALMIQLTNAKKISLSYMEDNSEIPAGEIWSRYGDTINFHLDNIIDPPNDDAEMILVKPSPYFRIDCLPRSLVQTPRQLNINEQLIIKAQSLHANYDELILLLNIAQHAACAFMLFVFKRLGLAKRQSILWWPSMELFVVGCQTIFHTPSV